MTIMSDILTIALTFWILMNSFGNIPLFISVLQEIPPQKSRIIVVRELLIALALILFFSVFGNSIFQAMGIKQSSVQMAGGIILFVISIKMVFPAAHKESSESRPKSEPFIVPLAVPLVAGPSVLSAAMVYGNQTVWWQLLIAITLAWVATVVVLLAALPIKNVLGQRGLLACERLMGLLLTIMAVEIFSEGISQFLSSVMGTGAANTG
jgi:multiple antibiotic resistance protein